MLRGAFQEHLHGPLDQSIERPFFLVLCVLVEVRSGIGFLKNVAPEKCAVRAAGSDMSTIDDVSGVLRSLAPHHLAEEWDNVGLLVGDRKRPVKRIMTCLTVTPESVQEAIDQQVELIVSHHCLLYTSPSPRD